MARTARGTGINAIYLDPAPRNLTSAEFMATKPRRALPRLHSQRSARDLDAAVGQGAERRADQGRLRLCLGKHSCASKPRTLKAAQGSRRKSSADVRRVSADAARRSSCSAAPDATDARQTARDPTRSTSLRVRATYATPHSSRASPDQRLFESINYGVEGTAMPSWMDYGLPQTDVGDIVNLHPQSESRPTGK